MPTNKFAGTCSKCAGSVPAGAGVLSKLSGKWTVSHTGTCPTVAAEPAARSASPRPTLTPTGEQRAIVDMFLTGEDLVIEAGAGASKTTTLWMCAEADPNRIGRYMAFNKKLVTEASEGAPGNVAVSTVHSLAHQAIMGPNRAHRARILDGHRMRSMDMARILRLDNFTWSYGKERHTIGRDRLAGMAIAAVRRFCQSADPVPNETHIAYVDGIDLPTEDGDRTYGNNELLRRHLMPAVRLAWQDLSNPAGGQLTMKRADYVYLKMWALDDPAILADFLLVDEAQDLSGVMLQILDKQTCQRVLVGDSAQAIYGFLGLVDALAIYRERGARVGRLSKSFRFGQAVADVANGLLERAGHDLRLVGFERVLSTVGPHPEPTAILTRTNATAVRTCLTYLADGRKPHLVGGADEVVRFAEAAQALMDGQPTSHPDLSIFDNWGQVKEYADQDENGADLQLMVRLVDEFGPAVIIDGLGRTAARPDGDDVDVIVSTAHKSKGCGWDVVQIADDFTPPKEGGMSKDELRLAYVAVTRAKRHLDIEAVPHFLFEPGTEAYEAAIAANQPTQAEGAVLVADLSDEDIDAAAALELTIKYNTPLPRAATGQ